LGKCPYDIANEIKGIMKKVKPRRLVDIKRTVKDFISN
jgi:hypothetical protein